MDRSLHPVVRTPYPLLSDQVIRQQGGQLIHITLLVCDQVLVFLAFLVAYWMRYRVNWSPALKPIFSEVAVENQVSFQAFLPVTLVLIGTLTILFETKGLYRRPRGTGLVDYAGIIVSSTLIGIALVIVLVFFHRPFYYSRLVFLVAGFNIVVMLVAWRALMLMVRQWAWSRGFGQDRVLVVGGNGLSKQVMDGIAAHPGLGYHLVGYLHDDPQMHPGQTSYRHLGTIESLQHIITSNSVDRVILALPFWEHRRLPQLVQLCRSLGIEFQIAPDLYEISFDRVDVLNISGVPLIGLKELNLKGWNLAMKRALDIALVLLTAPVMLPFIGLIAVLIRLDSSGTSFFRQRRVGRNGHVFTCYKFRTMVPDAEQRKAELAALNEADGPLFKIRHDPRITRIGRFLRRSSLDELPQLWNVLCGDMSLVGPRPALPDEVAQYSDTHRRRLEVTPGLTGLWQVLGRCETTFDEMVRLDIYYAENWSLWLDMVILLKTIPVVLIGKGAY